MRGKAQERAGGHFQVSSQSGGSIQNVGGNLYLGEARRRGAAIGRAVAALGLALFFAGLILLAVDVYHQTNGFSDSSSLAQPEHLRHAVGLVVAGFVLSRFGRLFARR
jgi:hypothetical protein